MDLLRIATRQSPLAIWQANEVKRKLQILHPGLQIELLEMRTLGDKILDSPLNKIGGKGLFVKELEQGLLNEEADIAVHSMKDVPMVLPTGLHLPVILKREDPHDAFVSNRYDRPEDLPDGAIVGTSSLRRQAQLRSRFPQLLAKPLRGNVGSRLKKLDSGEYDAIVIAVAGLARLQMSDRISQLLPSNLVLPAVGQGAIGIECREGDLVVEQIISSLHDLLTAHCICAERSMNRALNGGCQAPIAGYALFQSDGQLWLRGRVGDPEGRQLIEADLRGDAGSAEELGQTLANTLLQSGADKILAALGLQQD